jgi:hypothetical protein
VGGGTQGPPIHLGETEGGVVGGHDHVGVADEADAPAHAEPVHGGDHRHLAVVHGGEGLVAAPVGADQGLVALGGLHLLDVDTGVEAPALGPQHHHADGLVVSEPSDDVGQLEPAGHVEGVHRWVVHHHLGDAPLVDVRRDPHRATF